MLGHSVRLISRYNNPTILQNPRRLVVRAAVPGGLAAGTYSNGGLNSTAQIRRGVKFEAGSKLLGVPIREVWWLMRRVGSPTGDMTFTARSAADVVTNTFGTYDSAALLTTYRWIVIRMNNYMPTEVNSRLLAEYSGGDGSNTPNLLRRTDINGIGDNNSPSTAFIASYSDVISNSNCMIFYG